MCQNRFHLFLIIACFFSVITANAQVDSASRPADTTIVGSTLQDVRVTAYDHNRSLRDVPAAVNYIGTAGFQRYGNHSIVQAVNATPGVRMEERSPGSYRFNIRGSSLRSPFGVRNVKVYFNDLPFTDPGGTSYVNQLGKYNFGSMEIVKGPGSSLYGPGTGGVLLVNELPPYPSAGASVEYSAGSFDYHQLYGNIGVGKESAFNSLSFQHQQQEGYRQQSALRRNVYSWTGRYLLNEKQILKTSFLYGDLLYETPGGLTKTEYESNARAARPGGGGFPGAVAARAAIRQKTFLAGASYDQELATWLRNKTALYGMFTQLINPNLRQYERSWLPHLGGRTDFQLRHSWTSADFSINFGGEWQQSFGTLKVYKNVDGRADSLRSSDETENRQALVFVQATLDLATKWTLVAGGSVNWYRLRFESFTPAASGARSRTFSNEWAPRLALLRRLGPVSIYTSVSRGCSPPTTAEILPSGGSWNPELEAEDGINYDLGIRGMAARRLSFDLNIFLFRLQHTIVLRKDAGGGDYYINAGKTSQKGLELAVSAPVVSSGGWIAGDRAWSSYTYHHFRYKDFRQGTTDFSGNALPGVAPHTVAAGYDLFLTHGISSFLTYYYSDRLALNDANSFYAASYHLLGMKISYRLPLKGRLRFDLTIGGDNLLDEKYSLGNDVNAFGGRFYNVAAGRNYFATLGLRLGKQPS